MRSQDVSPKSSTFNVIFVDDDNHDDDDGVKAKGDLATAVIRSSLSPPSRVDGGGVVNARSL
jgi:hypothetical protein